MLPAVPWIGSTMIAAMSLLGSTAILCLRNSTQRHSHDGNDLSKAQRAQLAYGVEYAPGCSGPSPCLNELPSNGSTPRVLPWKPPQNPIPSPRPVCDCASRSAASPASAPLE